MIDFDEALLRPEEPFALGAAQYWDADPELKELQSRIYVRFRPEGVEPKRSFLALFDTGAHYCILNAGVVDLIRDQLSEPLGPMKLQTAHGPVWGQLHRHRIQLVAEAGKDLVVDSTVFIPPDWRAPCFLGYTGMLDRLRFAINPQTNRFYFGPLE